MTSDAEDTNLLAALGRRWAKTMAKVLAQKVIVGPNIQKLRHHLEPTSNIYGHTRYATFSTDVADSRRQHIDMNCPNSFVRTLRAANISQRLCQSTPRATRSAFTRPLHRQFTNTSRRADKQAADDPNFTSILDAPPQIVRAGKRHGPGIILLALIPITAFALGTWQVQRLGWKTELIAKFEDRLVRDPLPLPPTIDPSAIHEFDYRRVYATGTFRHDQEMLIGPRMRDGKDGYMVVTPLERENGTTILVNRGWINKAHRDPRTRPDSLPKGKVTVEGLLREPWKKNMFTPENRPEKGQFYFPDVKQMAELTGSQPVWVEVTMEPEFMKMMDFEARGIPYGRAAEVNLRNNHAQYIFTWYGLSVATAIMLFMVLKKPASSITRRVQATKNF
ncbi:surfeit 1 [Pochonia chlamydosporia 170]|uniref:SURF1-like protein n=1 Tax=Pochonia chlamydosporia 170 TaxID=1380566 RepID=A0A179FSU3_METCM|nr:surfeit 1 [Pochonia chlamydosporia 170]OAQ68682.1 surfeit 1 [Pochonia chlamydosporia 170]